MFLSSVLSVLAARQLRTDAGKARHSRTHLKRGPHSVLHDGQPCSVAYVGGIAHYLHTERVYMTWPHSGLTPSVGISAPAFLLQTLPIKAMTPAPNTLQWQVSHPKLLTALAMPPTSSGLNTCTYLQEAGLNRGVLLQGHIVEVTPEHRLIVVDILQGHMHHS